MLNPVISRMAGQPVMVSEAHQGWFTECLRGLSGTNQQLSDSLVKHQLESKMADDFWPAEGSWLSQFRPYSVKNGILTIPVAGVLVSGFPYTFFGMITGYEYISKAIDRGVTDQNVKGIILEINSPGGEVSGNFDLADKIFGARGSKPIKAIASEHAYSAAYSLASAADDITVARTGGLGSIGVVTMHVDVSQAYEEAGIKVTFIHAGEHKVDGNPYQPLPESVKNRIQENINQLYNLFVTTVARNRDMSEEDVRKTEALTFSAQESLSNGLADAIGSIEETMAAFSASVNNQGSVAMTTQSNEDVTAKIEAAKAQGKAEGKTEGLAEGAKAERARVAAIAALPEAEKRKAAAFNLATNTDMSVEQAQTLLATLPEESAAKASGQDFKAAMDSGDNPNLGADGGKTEASADKRIVADYKAAGGQIG